MVTSVPGLPTAPVLRSASLPSFSRTLVSRSILPSPLPHPGQSACRGQVPSGADAGAFRGQAGTCVVLASLALHLHASGVPLAEPTYCFLSYPLCFSPLQLPLVVQPCSMLHGSYLGPISAPQFCTYGLPTAWMPFFLCLEPGLFFNAF